MKTERYVREKIPGTKFYVLAETSELSWIFYIESKGWKELIRFSTEVGDDEVEVERIIRAIKEGIMTLLRMENKIPETDA